MLCLINKCFPVLGILSRMKCYIVFACIPRQGYTRYRPGSYLPWYRRPVNTVLIFSNGKKNSRLKNIGWLIPKKFVCNAKALSQKNIVVKHIVEHFFAAIASANTTNLKI